MYRGKYSKVLCRWEEKQRQRQPQQEQRTGSRTEPSGGRREGNQLRATDPWCDLFNGWPKCLRIVHLVISMSCQPESKSPCRRVSLITICFHRVISLVPLLPFLLLHSLSSECDSSISSTTGPNTSSWMELVHIIFGLSWCRGCSLDLDVPVLAGLWPDDVEHRI